MATWRITIAARHPSKPNPSATVGCTLRSNERAADAEGGLLALLGVFAAA
jgi:hypothetical protein